ncbi:methionyl-tRNA formyltransferase [Actibacterium lipolyticum]|uniref:Bifunctional polymyxin resistance protein ArnA n=1 Tax=Actibacterium lipolyticum TaxID=1524263 RepID=A0A238KXA9_9RHOB|nr:formyltransferase family protein [Actibacterium lipolyticum]SMX47328.1 Bifunctional polymyxin resistance protein ArnA [Actibacterium lipolyticum]
MKSVLVGAVESTKCALETMCACDRAPALVVTLPPDLAKRHSDFVDLGPLAEQHGIKVHHTQKSNAPETLAALRDVDADVVLVIGWSQLCNEEFRAIPRIGCLGYHPTALPKLRGRAVIPWTILLGEDRSGASIFWLGDGADTGDIAAQLVFPIDPHEETARGLYDKQLDAIKELLPPLLHRLAAGDVPRRVQDHDKATICARRGPEDGLIDWQQPAEDIHRLIRAVGPPYPGAFTYGADGTQVVITAATRSEDSARYIGMPGQIQAIDGDTLTVMCGDGQCLNVTDWHGPDTRPKLHSKFGMLK